MGEPKESSKLECTIVDTEACIEIPVSECSAVDTEVCLPVSTTTCENTPRDACTSIDIELCKNVPEEVCNEAEVEVCNAPCTNTVRSPHFLVGGSNYQYLHTAEQSKVQPSARAWRVQSRAVSYFIYLFIYRPIS